MHRWWWSGSFRPFATAEPGADGARLPGARAPVTTIVGLTGNIASGKSTVAALLAAMGALIIDADVLARRAVEPGTAELAAIKARWPGVVAPDGTLDRGALRQVVFADPEARSVLNDIVHPAVARLRDAEIADARRRGAALVVYDVPLLFEAGLEGEVDRIVLVDAPEGVRRARLMRDRGLSEADANAMIASQMPAEAKRRRAHFVVQNDADRDALARRVDALWNTLARGPSAG